MIPIVVNDASCLIDLRKGQLLESFLQLPYRLVVPLPIREKEWPGITPRDWRRLEGLGLHTVDRSDDQVARAMEIKVQLAGLSANDCLALATAEHQPGSILLTGDGPL